MFDGVEGKFNCKILKSKYIVRTQIIRENYATKLISLLICYLDLFCSTYQILAQPFGTKFQHLLVAPYKSRNMPHCLTKLHLEGPHDF